jgi:competence protein ComEC
VIMPTALDNDRNFWIDILDVGHGSCVVISNGTSTILIDAGPGSPILEYMREQNIFEIETAVISHADQDHIGGLIAIIDSGIPVHNIYCNGDAEKSSKMWKALVYSLDDLKRRGVTAVLFEAVEGADFKSPFEQIEIEIIAPRYRLSRLGAGSTDKAGLAISTNSVSVVVRVLVDGRPLLLLPGDLDYVGFSHLADSGVDIQADYLVLPHHGGMLGTRSATATMVKALCTSVSPKQIYVSNGRTRFDNPQPGVVGAIREELPTVQIACTQLSRRCAPEEVVSRNDIPIYSAGAARGLCCAGSLRLTSSDGITDEKDLSEHAAFVDSHAPTALCRRL